MAWNDAVEDLIVLIVAPNGFYTASYLYYVTLNPGGGMSFARRAVASSGRSLSPD